jgi:hypothetical protein
MSETEKLDCPECDERPERCDNADRRHFLRLIGGGAAGFRVVCVVPPSENLGR